MKLFINGSGETAYGPLEIVKYVCLLKIFRLVVIGLKVTYLTVMMILTIIAYQKKKRGFLNVQTALCVFYIFEVWALTLKCFRWSP